MKRLGFVLLLFLMLVSLTACGGERAVEAGADAGGGTLRVALNSEPTTLNPYIWAALNDRNVFLQLYNSLMEYDPQTLKPVPGLIREAKASEDGLTYTFTLQEGVTFHNGKPMTADDVKASLAKAMTPEATRTAPLLKAIKEVKVDGDRQLTVLLNNRDSLLLDSLVEVFVTPNDPSIDHSKHPVGTGPFKLNAWVRNEKVVLEKNEAYWKQGLPKLSRLEFVPIPDAEVKTLQLLNGQVDFIDIAPITRLGEIEKSTDYQLARLGEESAIQDHLMLINNAKAPMNDRRFRKALDYALDREVIKKALFGNFVVRSGPLPDSHETANRDIPKTTMDKAKARELLKASGYKGEPVELLYHKIDSMYDIVAQIAEQSLKDIGVNVTLRGVEIAQFSQLVFTKKSYDLALTGIVPKPNPVDMLNHPFGKTNGASMQWQSKEWAANLLRVSQLPEAEGRELLKQLQSQLADQMPGIIVGGLIQTPAMSRAVSGFVPNPQSKLYFETVSVSKK